MTPVFKRRWRERVQRKLKRWEGTQVSLQELTERWLEEQPFFPVFLMLLCHYQLSHLVVWSLVLPFLTCPFFWLLYPITSHDPCVSSSSLLNICLSYHSVSVKDERSWKEMLWLISEGWSWSQGPHSRRNCHSSQADTLIHHLKGAWCGKAMQDHRRKSFPLYQRGKGRELTRRMVKGWGVPGFDSSLQPLNSQMGYQNVAENLRLL